jgi:hypothetical protein
LKARRIQTRAETKYRSLIEKTRFERESRTFHRTGKEKSGQARPPIRCAWLFQEPEGMIDEKIIL